MAEQRTPVQITERDTEAMLAKLAGFAGTLPPAERQALGVLVHLARSSAAHAGDDVQGYHVTFTFAKVEYGLVPVVTKSLLAADVADVFFLKRTG